jgi:outer membrane protein TolC
MIRSFLLALLVAAAPPPVDTGPLPLEIVDAALDDAPVVTAAAARLEAARAQARALGIGAHEFTIAGTYIRRTVDNEGGYDEFDTTVSRGVRLPGKANLDRKAGALGVEVAENLLEDARHQAALQLATLWYDWLLAEAEARIGGDAAASYAQSAAAVDRQVTLRDAAPLDADQVRAARDNARSLEASAHGRAAAARASLAAQFPSLPLPGGVPDIAAPVLPPEGLAQWRDLVLERSHEIRAAELEAARLGAVAERTKLDRFADPSVGVRAFSERSGAERGIGVVASLPIGGGYRRALGDQAVAERTAAEAQLAATRREIRATADMDLATASAGITAWRAAVTAADSSRSAASRLRTGRRLGATDLATLLTGERDAIEAARAELAARAVAVRAILKLRIDAHLLWAKPEASEAPPVRP